MLKAELGDLLYYIIFAVVILAGLLEKVAKSKRQQQQAGTPPPPQPYDDFEDVEEQRQAPPNTLEEVMKRMLETVETHKQEEAAFYPEKAQSSEMDTEEAQSSEYIPMSCRRYQPVEVQMLQQSEKRAYSPILIEEEKVLPEIHEYEYEFDIRQAVISSEILNRKY